MAIRCGFFNSIGQDRLYQAEDMNEPYKELVSNGVFATRSDYLQVVANSGMSVTVKAGRGIFADKWFVSDSDMTLTLASAPVELSRIDSVVVRVDTSESTRGASIVIKTGTASSSPVAPTITRTDYIKEYRLANIKVGKGVTTIAQQNITDTRAHADCGIVTGLIDQVDTDTLWKQWEDAFNTWFSDIKETLATSTLIRSYEHTHTTTIQDEVDIPIGISQFNRNLDILQVYINGLMLIKGVEYTVTDNTAIKLTNGVDKGTPISFIVYKSIDGSDAETVVQQVYELQNIVNASRATDVEGGAKLSITDTTKSLLDEFIALGVGLHTIYSTVGVQDSPTSSAGYRSIGQLNTPNNGWIMSFHTNGSVYTNFYFSGEWRGWRAVYEAVPEPLWSGTSLIGEGVTITPSKPLNQCAHGWQLVFSDYNDDTSTASSSDLSTVMIPKRNLTGANWGGSSFLCLVPTYLAEDGAHNMCVKRVYVYPDRLEGHASNALGSVQRDACLRAIYEY